MEYIYAVTCYYVESLAELKKGEFSPAGFIRTREWGFYFNLASAFNSAFNCVKYNFTDIYENGYYNLVCIEERAEGIATEGETEYWFEVVYSPEDRRYQVNFLEKCFFQQCYSLGYQTELPESVANYLTKYEIRKKINEEQQIDLEIIDLITNEKNKIKANVVVNNDQELELSHLKVAYSDVSVAGVLQLSSTVTARVCRQ